MTAESVDLSISGLIYDGLGNPPKAGTIGIHKGLIVCVGDTSIISDRHINASHLDSSMFIRTLMSVFILTVEAKVKFFRALPPK